MSKLNSETYDVIIIGAGISGLVCGCYLAKAGMKILVVEQHDKPGGYCTSFRRGDFIFDSAAHSFGSYREGGNFRKIVKELGVDEMVSIKRFNPSDIVVAPDFSVTFWNNIDSTVDNIAQQFPEEKLNLMNYFAYYDDSAPTSQLENIKLKNSTFASFLSSFSANKRMMDTISYPVVGNGGLPPSLMSAFTGTKIFREFMIDGGYYPEGGMQELSNAFAQVIKQHGGTIFLKRFAKKILVKNNTVSGIVLDDNETYFSKYIVSACDITQTYKKFLRGEGNVNIINNKLKEMSPAISTFTLYLGIDKPFKELPEPGTNLWHLPCYDFDMMFRHVKKVSLDNFGGGGFMLRLSPDRKTILAFCITSYKTSSFWRNNKKGLADDFLKRIETIIPNLKKHIVFFDAASPYTLFRYTLNYKGANYGWAPTPSQLFDPFFRQKSSIHGLYLTGHWTAQTHGIPGVAYLGYNTSKLILKQEKIIS
jgi:phytoene dehydrogenase-like protein